MRRGLTLTVAAYETVALGTRRIPTITAIVHHHRHRNLTVIVVLAALGYTLWHLLIEGRP